MYIYITQQIPRAVGVGSPRVLFGLGWGVSEYYFILPTRKFFPPKFLLIVVTDIYKNTLVKMYLSLSLSLSLSVQVFFKIFFFWAFRCWTFSNFQFTCSILNCSYLIPCCVIVFVKCLSKKKKKKKDLCSHCKTFMSSIYLPGKIRLHLDKFVLWSIHHFRVVFKNNFDGLVFEFGKFTTFTFIDIFSAWDEHLLEELWIKSIKFNLTFCKLFMLQRSFWTWSSQGRVQEVGNIKCCIWKCLWYVLRSDESRNFEKVGGGGKGAM
jgi:hypothetical protein